MSQVLITDSAGMPKDWVDFDVAINYYVNDKVLWQIGAKVKTFYGGFNAITGLQSYIDISAIVGVSGPLFGDKFLKTQTSHLATSSILFARDRNMCAYCGDLFPNSVLTTDHVLPKSRGGTKAWTNVVSACKLCNNRKGNRTPEEARMPLLYVPYQPSIFEKMILKNRRILADQMEFLLARVPKNSRLHALHS